MDKNPLYPIGCETYLNPERQRKSGTHATIDWDYRNPFESDLGGVYFVLLSEECMNKTQVIPLTSGDTILTRLTHSMLVMLGGVGSSTQ